MNFKKMLLDGIYPRCCPICHQIVRPKGALVCPKCVEKLSPIQQPRCQKCGKSLSDDGREYCGDCERSPHQYDQGIGIYPYNDKMRKSIENYKFYGRREYGDFYIQAMIHYGKAHILRWRPDCILPIPMLPKKQRLRGFNQAEYLAKGLGEYFKIPVKTRDICRVQGGRAQKELTASERRRNLRQAFQVGPEYQPHQRVLLVDDVYTTGSTIDAVARVLKANGTKHVYFLTLCQGKGI